MGRMLSSKPFPAPVAGRPVAPEKPGVGAAFLGPPVLKPSAAGPRVDSDETHVFRKIVVGFSLAVLFVRFTVLPEVVAYITGVDTYLLYVTAVPAIAACLLSGGLRRTFRLRAPYWWMAFFVWMVLATPFSFWPGGSARMLFDYVRTDLVFMVIAGGLAVQWGEIRALFYTIAAASLVNLVTAQLFMDTANGRISVSASGTIGNSNDLSAHLLLVLPFLLFVTMDRKRTLLIRIPLLLGIAYGLRIILGTASRGALLALMVGFLFMLWRASPAQRVLTMVGAVLLGGLFAVVLPSVTLSRLGNLFGGEHREAEESGEIRSYLVKQSIQYTIKHPIFGIGPGQFPNFEGHTRVTEGKTGAWKSTHCDFTQVSAESGIPALIFFLAALGSAFSVVFRTQRRAVQKGNVEIANACFCYLLSMVMFLVASAFIPNAYYFYMPVMVGLAVSIKFAADRQLGVDDAAPNLRPLVSAAH
jgi:O-antigen ligase